MSGSRPSWGSWPRRNSTVGASAGTLRESSELQGKGRLGMAVVLVSKGRATGWRCFEVVDTGDAGSSGGTAEGRTTGIQSTKYDFRKPTRTLALSLVLCGWNRRGMGIRWESGWRQLRSIRGLH